MERPELWSLDSSSPCSRAGPSAPHCSPSHGRCRNRASAGYEEESAELPLGPLTCHDLIHELAKPQAKLTHSVPGPLPSGRNTPQPAGPQQGQLTSAGRCTLTDLSPARWLLSTEEEYCVAGVETDPSAPIRTCMLCSRLLLSWPVCSRSASGPEEAGRVHMLHRGSAGCPVRRPHQDPEIVSKGTWPSVPAPAPGADGSH